MKYLNINSLKIWGMEDLKNIRKKGEHVIINLSEHQY